eukprot:CAMPEP_0195638080 /NCGR_PEP_ID=MMETSP0815-20121206/24797_1 /TAXON_ID=97485 /ORGANISM="Prymnesium parvum, Strain Texoma1" /LENGTH=171 /DNA_ID=CAMNT_0040780403 /DNA_START=93 /DNA_END=606 /DNA_ORIENTATION=-
MMDTYDIGPSLRWVDAPLQEACCMMESVLDSTAARSAFDVPRRRGRASEVLLSSSSAPICTSNRALWLRRSASSRPSARSRRRRTLAFGGVGGGGLKQPQPALRQEHAPDAAILRNCSGPLPGCGSMVTVGSLSHASTDHGPSRSPIKSSDCAYTMSITATTREITIEDST